MSATQRTVRDGLVVGLIAYAAVALFYAAFDVLAARGALYTVDLLGKATFRGVRDPAVLMFPMQADLTSVMLYNALHLLVSLAIGLTVTELVDFAERHPRRTPGVLAFIVAGFVVTVVGVTALTTPIRPLLPVWSIVFANVLSVIVGAAYLVRRRPGVVALFTLRQSSLAAR